MPFIDVTDLLVDPDIAAQSFTVLRRRETVTNYGESTWLTVKSPAIGSIQPSGDQSLIREEGFDAQHRTIKIVTTFRLRGVTKGPSGARYKPDIILWHDNYYEVISPVDWSDFGAGMIEAEAAAIHYIDNSPRYIPPFVGRLDFSKPSNAFYAHGAGGMGC
jgi:hypothetical protein